MDGNTNDNDVTVGRRIEPDAHGQAAMLLVESLIHGLIARSVITVPEAIEIVDVAADVKIEVADDMGESNAAMQRSLNMLTAISHTLATDLPDDGSA